MKIIYNNIIPFRGFAVVNLFGVLFVRKNVILTDRIINHERIHTAQMKELFYIGFYVWYLAEWLYKLPRYGNQAYYNISFEREAYSGEGAASYLNNRRCFNFLNFR
jgi:hypothetical protein